MSASTLSCVHWFLSERGHFGIGGTFPAAELEQSLRDAGLEQWAAPLAALVRPCIILVPGKGAEHAPLGTRRLGGEADVLPAVEWPLRSAYELRPAELPGRQECERFYGTGDNWQIVLQIWGDSIAGMGDDGRLYVCAPCRSGSAAL